MVARLTMISKKTPEEKADAALRSSILSALRRIWMFHGENRQDCLGHGRRVSQSDNKRLKWEHKCVSCNQWFPQSEIKVDHIVACGGLPNWECLTEYARRLFFGAVQKLCKSCHDIKTKEERRK